MDNDKIHISFTDTKEGRVWFLMRGLQYIPVTTEGMKDLYEQLKVHESLDFKSPF